MAKLFDKVKSGLDKGLAAVSVKSQEILEVTKIKNQIGNIKDQITNIQTQIGEAVYQMYLQGSFDQNGLQELCESIKALEAQIREKEAELQAVRVKAAEAMGKRLCENCKAEIDEGVKFCGNCGNKVAGG